MLGGGDFIACRFRAVFNGMRISDPASVETGYCAKAYSHCGFSDLCTIPDMNLQCGVKGSYPVNAACSVACLAWSVREKGATHLVRMACVQGDIPLKD